GRAERADTRSVAEVRAGAGKGLEGDRYHALAGTWSPEDGPHDVTLIEAEALDAVRRDHGIDVEPGEPRRNVITSGVALNHLVGRRFRVGAIELEGDELADPCRIMDKVRPGLREALVHRGGLRARILTD